MSKLSDTFRKSLLTQMGDMSLRELAKRSKIAHPTLSRIINDHTVPNLDTVEAIAYGLDIVPALMIGGSDGRTYDIPQDILEMLDGQSPNVHDAIRSILKTIASEKKSKKKAT